MANRQIRQEILNEHSVWLKFASNSYAASTDRRTFALISNTSFASATCRTMYFYYFQCRHNTPKLTTWHNTCRCVARVRTWSLKCKAGFTYRHIHTWWSNALSRYRQSKTTLSHNISKSSVLLVKRKIFLVYPFDCCWYTICRVKTLYVPFTSMYTLWSIENHSSWNIWPQSRWELFFVGFESSTRALLHLEE